MSFKSALRPILRQITASTPLRTFKSSPFPHAESSSQAATRKPKPASKTISSCPAGTKLTGLSILKDQPDPVALPDEEYPAWLWTILDEPNTSASTGGEDEGKVFDFKTERKKLRATNRSNIKAQNYLKTT